MAQAESAPTQVDRPNQQLPEVPPQTPVVTEVPAASAKIGYEKGATSTPDGPAEAISMQGKISISIIARRLGKSSSNAGLVSC